MATKTLWITADCSRSTSVTPQQNNASHWSNTSNDYVILVGDNAYDNGANTDYTSHFDHAYGAGAVADGFTDYRSRMIAVPGNHEYHTTDAGGFRTYWTGRGQMPALPRGGFAHQRGNCRTPLTLNGWTLIFLDTAGDKNGAYAVDAVPGANSPWISTYISDLDSWLAGVNSKACLVFGHHMRFNPAGTGGHGSQSGSDPPWQRMWNTDGTCKIAAWIGGHDHYLIATKLLSKTGGVVSDETRGARFLGTGAGAGAFDTPGGQTWKDWGAGGLYGFLKITIPDTIGGEPQDITADFYTTGNNGQGSLAHPKSYTISATGGTTPPPPPPGGPTATTNAASAITNTTVTLNGTVNPNSAATTYHFEYGATASYGSTTTSASAGSGSTDVAETANLTGLTAGATYHYRIVATNANGTDNGGDRTFTTTGGGGGTSIILDDDFNRTIAQGGGVGTANTGNTYSVAPAADWEVNGDEAVAHLVNTSVHSIVPQGMPQTADLEWLIQWNLGSPPSVAGQQVTGYFIFRFQDNNNLYRCRVVCQTTDAVQTTLQRLKVVPPATTGTLTQLGSVVTSEPAGSVLGGRNFQTRIRITGGDAPRLRAKTWIAANAEPAAWDTDVTDSDPLAGTGTFQSRWSIPALPSSAIGAHLDNWTITSLDVAPPQNPPATPILTGCPSDGHVTSSPVSFSLSPGDSVPVDHYEHSEDNGVTWTTAASSYTVSISASQTKTTLARAVGADGQTSGTASCTFTRDPSGGGTNIDRFTPLVGLVGYRIRSIVTPTNAAGAGSPVRSAWSAPVTASSTTPVNSVAPSLTGTGVIGDAITLDYGVWTPTPDEHFVQWLADGSVVQTFGQSYVPVQADAGKLITARVEARSGSSISGWVDTSNGITVTTTLEPPSWTSPPFIVAPGGDPNVGETLSIDLGEYVGTPPITFTYQWLRGPSQNGPFTAIAGANGATYKLQAIDLGLWIDCDVTPHNPATT